MILVIEYVPTLHFIVVSLSIQLSEIPSTIKEVSSLHPYNERC